MINSFEPKHCPFCQSESFIKYGHDRNGINRYKCVCGKSFKPTTGTIFDSRKIGICEWIEYCLNIFRYVSLNADSWNNRNAISTSKYWLEKLFLTLENSQSNVVLSGTVCLDSHFHLPSTGFAINRHSATHDTVASSTSLIRIHSGALRCDDPYCL